MLPSNSISCRCESDAFVRCFLQISLVADVKTTLSCDASFNFETFKLWIRSFRAMLPSNPKSWRCENEAFVRGFLCSTLFYPTLRYSPLLYSTLLCPTRLYPTRLFSTLLYSTLLYSTLLCSPLLCSTLLCSSLLCPTLFCSTLFETTLLYSTGHNDLLICDDDVQQVPTGHTDLC